MIVISFTTTKSVPTLAFDRSILNIQCRDRQLQPLPTCMGLNSPSNCILKPERRLKNKFLEYFHNSLADPWLLWNAPKSDNNNSNPFKLQRSEIGSSIQYGKRRIAIKTSFGRTLDLISKTDMFYICGFSGLPPIMHVEHGGTVDPKRAPSFT